MNYYNGRWRRFGMFLGYFACLSACGKSQKETPPPIRGHTEVKEQVWHGAASHHGERYCSYCHGQALTGGSRFEPSCFACHGKNWQDDSFALSFAPETHTAEFKGYRHEPGFAEAASVCITCHGKELQGDTTLRTPSCYLCHDALW